MCHLQFSDLEECVITRGQKLKIRLDWQAKENLEDVKFRMIVRYRDDTPVGLVQSDSIGNACAGQILETEFVFDTSMLSEGKYFFSIALFQSDGVGGSIILDHVTRACSIEVLSPVDDNKLLNWEHRWWGSVRFPDLTIIK
jgi:hypothetical protein